MTASKDGHIPKGEDLKILPVQSTESWYHGGLCTGSDFISPPKEQPKQTDILD